MAVVVTKTDHWNSQGRMTVLANVVFSGSYATGGELYDFAAVQWGYIQPIWVHIQGKAGYFYEYDFTNKKIIVRQQINPAAAGGADVPFSELAAAAYPAGVTGDSVKALTIAKIN